MLFMELLFYETICDYLLVAQRWWVRKINRHSLHSSLCSCKMNLKWFANVKSAYHLSFITQMFNILTKLMFTKWSITIMYIISLYWLVQTLLYKSYHLSKAYITFALCRWASNTCISNNFSIPQGLLEGL